MNMVYSLVASKLNLSENQVRTVMGLVEKGATVPFIARYRKEMTNGLDEEAIRNIISETEKQKKLADRKLSIISSLKERNILFESLENMIKNAQTLAELESIYSPYKTSRKTRAQKAREMGLDVLVEKFKKTPRQLRSIMQDFLSTSSFDEETVVDGIKDIIAEDMSVNQKSREKSLVLSRQQGYLQTTPIPPEKRKAAKGYEGQEMKESKIAEDVMQLKISRLRPHQALALRRAEKRGQIKLKWEFPEKRIISILKENFPVKSRDIDGFAQKVLDESAKDSYSRLLGPSLQRQIYRELIEKAEQHSIDVFAKNVKNLLLQPPLKGHKIMGLDPGLRTGTKVAIIDENGSVLYTSTVNTLSTNSAEKEFTHLINTYHVTYIALGNGTGSRDVEKILSNIFKKTGCKYAIVPETGASVYSASKLAQQEFPDLDVSLRGAISIARRLMDPMAELIKIDPKSLGIGQYQHDLNQKLLQKKLDETLEEVVNLVGVDVNTASSHLLQYVSGLNKKIADAIVKFRKTKPITNREMLKSIKGIGEKTFEQSAGFLRVYNGDNPLDATSIHPESYSVTTQFLSKLGFELSDLQKNHSSVQKTISKLSSKQINSFIEELNIGKETFLDILDNLKNPFFDPRGSFQETMFDQNVRTIEDLEVGMILPGEVRNVTDFGAFVDIGVKHDGLVHISQLSDKFVNHPSEVVKVGQKVHVKIISVEKNRISLSMKEVKDKSLLQKEN